MKIKINKAIYAKSLTPWCPYVGGFWVNLIAGNTSLLWAGYIIDIKRGN